tara:strand:- start:1223 stop:1378 length:156 start_codon:yes stop_codon:yes gene_type:complete
MSAPPVLDGARAQAVGVVASSSVSEEACPAKTKSRMLSSALYDKGARSPLG